MNFCCKVRRRLAADIAREIRDRCLAELGAHGLLGTEHHHVNTANAVRRPARRAITEDRALAPDFLALEQRFGPFDRVNDIEHADLIGGSSEQITAPDSLRCADDARLFELRELVRLMIRNSFEKLRDGRPQPPCMRDRIASESIHMGPANGGLRGFGHIAGRGGEARRVDNQSLMHDERGRFDQN